MDEAKENPRTEHHSNGHVHNEPPSPRPRSALTALIQDFSPVWVTWSMNIGILSILIHTLPYQFHGQRVISTVLYVVDLIIFILCCTLMSLRFLKHGKTAWTEITSDVNELCFMSCFPIAWMTLTILTSTIVSNAYWGGHAFTLVSYVMWWIAVAWVMLFALGIYILLTLKSLTEARQLSLAIILPAVATSTAAVEGGLLAMYSKDISARLAVPVIILSFMLVGIGIFVALCIFALFLQRILVNSWFDPVKRPTLCILLGPAGQSAAALMALGTASTTHFAEYGKGPFLQQQTANALHAGCVLFALMLFGLGIFWALFAVYGILDAVLRGQAKWTPAWYSTIFPTGMCISSRQLQTLTLSRHDV
jgi:tellurite resistance protein TehA-like permease